MNIKVFMIALRYETVLCVIVCRLKANAPPTPFRYFITNESGYNLDISQYKEETDPVTGQVKQNYIYISSQSNL